MPTSPKPERVSASEANRSFSKLLQGVREGRRYLVTSHGEPVARLEPPMADTPVPADVVASRLRHLEELAARPALNAWRWNREELYDEMLSEPFKP